MNFFLFAGLNYYPNGGAEDFVGAYRSASAAMKAFASRDIPEYYVDVDIWAHVWHAGEKRIVAEYHQNLAQWIRIPRCKS